MMQNRVSVIMPIYNTIKYLRKAIDSIVQQTFVDWELILVDDGSTDGSAVICDEYAATDPRIRVVHISNHGVSYARNLGLKSATGEWVCFLDSDDEMEATAIATLLDGSNGADVVMGNYRFNADENRKIINRKSVYIPAISDQGIQELFFCDFFFTVWGKLYKRKVLQHQFPIEMSYGEDTCFNLKSFWDWKWVSLVPDCIVTHYGRYGSLSNRNYFDMPKRLRDVLEQYRETFAAYPGMRRAAFEHYTVSLRHYFWLHIRNQTMPDANKRLILSAWLTDESIDTNDEDATYLNPKQAAFWQMVRIQDADGIYSLLR